jgi:hypothetical protein
MVVNAFRLVASRVAEPQNAKSPPPLREVQTLTLLNPPDDSRVSTAEDGFNVADTA